MDETNRGLDLVRIRMIPDRTLVSPTPVSTPEEAVNLITREFGDLDREVFMILNMTCHLQVILNMTCHLQAINLDICSVGTLNYTVVHPREVFKSSILSNASSVLLIHNHPSGELEPSREDIDLTERMVSAGKILGIEVLDHLIIGTRERAYTSLRDRGVMEFPDRDWRELERAADRQPEHTL